MGTDLARVDALVRTPSRGILALHPGHDGDSIASNLAMAQVLEQRGHTVEVVSREEPLGAFAFLPGWERIRYVGDSEVDLTAYDVFWALDMSTASRDGIGQAHPADLEIVVIDHHHTNPGWGTVNVIDAAASSTTAVLWEVYQALGIPVSPELATTLLTGLATDTGFFGVETASHGFGVAALLVTAGADYGEVIYRVNNQLQATSVEGIVEGLRTLTIESDPPVAYMTLYGSENDDLESRVPLTSYLSRIKDTDFGALIGPEDEGRIRLEFRSHTPGYDVSAVAQRLGGGGHQAASGATFIGTLEQAIEAIREAARTVQAEQKDTHA